ncbi:hypothetical protein Q3H58_001105 [Pseudomonas psychrotolerans]|nr:hypothetical protein [Pseudomonas psychrotolerans]
MPKFVLLWTDLALYLLVAGTLFYAWRARRQPALRASWRRVLQDAPAMSAAVVLASFVAIALLDSVHYRPAAAGRARGPGADLCAHGALGPRWPARRYPAHPA